MLAASSLRCFQAIGRITTWGQGNKSSNAANYQCVPWQITDMQAG
jgi:hypothetical protein